MYKEDVTDQFANMIKIESKKKQQRQKNSAEGKSLKGKNTNSSKKA